MRRTEPARTEPAAGDAPPDGDLGFEGATGVLAVIAGAIAWSAVLVPALLDDQVRPHMPAAWWVMMATYLVVFLIDTLIDWTPARARWQGGVLLLLGCAIILSVPSYSVAGVLAVTTIVVVAFVAPLAVTCAVGVAQVAVIMLALERAGAEGPAGTLVWALAYGGFQLFAVAMVEATLREGRAREALDVANRELAQRHAELAQAQDRLATASREAERLRIARDLHDTMGHQLTALALNLEAASHVSAGSAAQATVAQCRDLARGLLGEVRAAVGRLREGAGDTGAEGGLPARLRAVAEATPGLDVRLDLDDLPPLTMAQADAVFHGVQEALTNAARHSGADRVEVDLRSEEGEVVVRVVDDGPGLVGPVRWGNGLRGMRERYAAAGGILTVHSAPGEGFRVVGRLPVTTGEAT